MKVLVLAFGTLCLLPNCLCQVWGQRVVAALQKGPRSPGVTQNQGPLFGGTPGTSVCGLIFRGTVPSGNNSYISRVGIHSGPFIGLLGRGGAFWDGGQGATLGFRV